MGLIIILRGCFSWSRLVECVRLFLKIMFSLIKVFAQNPLSLMDTTGRSLVVDPREHREKHPPLGAFHFKLSVQLKRPVAIQLPQNAVEYNYLPKTQESTYMNLSND